MHEKGRLGAENGEGGREALLCDDGRTMGGQVVVVDGCWAEAQRERDISVHRCVPKGLLSKASAR